MEFIKSTCSPVDQIIILKFSFRFCIIKRLKENQNIVCSLGHSLYPLIFIPVICISNHSKDLIDNINLQSYLLIWFHPIHPTPFRNLSN